MLAILSAACTHCRLCVSTAWLARRFVAQLGLWEQWARLHVEKTFGRHSAARLGTRPRLKSVFFQNSVRGSMRFLASWRLTEENKHSWIIAEFGQADTWDGSRSLDGT